MDPKRDITRTYFSQIGQDQYVFENFFYGKRSGVFLDVGAYDGEKFSNTLFFERYLGWNGLCIEPLPEAYAALYQKRRAKCLNVAVAGYEGEGKFLDVDAGTDEKMLSGLINCYDSRHKNRIDKQKTSENIITVPVRRLKLILEENDIHHIDYCSIDTEGAEYKILQDFDFDHISIDVLSIENNYDDARIRDLLKENGFTLVNTFHGYDELYVHGSFQPPSTTTIITPLVDATDFTSAALREFSKHLGSQTKPVDILYISNHLDALPKGVLGKLLRVQGEISPLDAINIGLSQAQTPFAMPFGITDRLTHDAVEQLCMSLQDQHAYSLACGDWLLTKSIDAKQLGERSHAMEVWPVADPNTLPEGKACRLGSGDANCAQIGPTCLIRLNDFTILPNTLRDGSRIRALSPDYWEVFLRSVGYGALARTPLIIGATDKYHNSITSESSLISQEALNGIGLDPDFHKITWRERYHQSTKVINDLVNAKTFLDSRKISLEEEVKVLNAQISKAGENHSALEKAIHALRQSLSAKEDQITRLADEKTMITQGKKGLQQDLSEMQEKLIGLTIESKKRKQHYQDNMVQNRIEIQKLQASTVSENAKNREVVREREKLRKEIQHLSDALRKSSQEIENQKILYTKIESKNTELNNMHTVLENKARYLNSKNNKIDNDNKIIEKTIEMLQGDISALLHSRWRRLGVKLGLAKDHKVPYLKDRFSTPKATEEHRNR